MLPVVALGVVVVVCCLPLVAFSIVGMSARYFADDFCTAAIVASHGFWDAQAFWYREWFGRFTFTALISGLEMLGPWTTSYMPALIVWLWLLAAIWAIWPVRLILRPPHSLSVTALAALAVTVTLAATPSIGESLFWSTGAVTYTLPLVLLTLLIGLAARRALRAGVTRADLPLGAMIAFIAAGFSETYMAFEVGLLGLALPATLATVLLLALGPGVVAAQSFGQVDRYRAEARTWDQRHSSLTGRSVDERFSVAEQSWGGTLVRVTADVEPDRTQIECAGWYYGPADG